MPSPRSHQQQATPEERYWQAVERWRDARHQFDQAPPEAVDLAIARLHAAELSLSLARKDVMTADKQTA